MAKADLNIDIELSGYKGRITHIFTREARPPFHQEDQFLVNVEFKEPHPEGIISTAVVIPAELVISSITLHPVASQRDVLLALIKREGNKQIGETIAQHKKERAERLERDAAKEHLDDMAREAEAVLRK